MHTDNTSLKPLQIGELTAEKPIIQGGMGVGVSRSSLAGAVAAEEASELFRRHRLDMTRKGLNGIRQDVTALP